MDIGGDERRHLEKGECQRRTCHDIGKGEAALADVLGHHLGQLSLPQVDVEVGRRSYLDRVRHGCKEKTCRVPEELNAGAHHSANYDHMI